MDDEIASDFTRIFYRQKDIDVGFDQVAFETLLKPDTPTQSVRCLWYQCVKKVPPVYHGWMITCWWQRANSGFSIFQQDVHDVLSKFLWHPAALLHQAETDAA